MLIFCVKHGVWPILSGVLGIKESISGESISIWLHLSPFLIKRTKWAHKVPREPQLSLNKMSLEYNRNHFHLFQFPHSRYLWWFWRNTLRRILTRGPSMPKSHTAQTFSNSYNILLWKWWWRAICFIHVPLELNFRNISFWSWLSLLIRIIPKRLQLKDVLHCGILSFSYKRSGTHVISSYPVSENVLLIFCRFKFILAVILNQVPRPFSLILDHIDHLIMDRSHPVWRSLYKRSL